MTSIIIIFHFDMIPSLPLAFLLLSGFCKTFYKQNQREYFIFITSQPKRHKNIECDAYKFWTSFFSCNEF